MCSRKERLEELFKKEKKIRKQIESKFPIKNKYDIFSFIMPCSENRPKGVPNELWEQYAQINDEIMTLEIDKYIEENFVDVKDIGKIRGLRA